MEVVNKVFVVTGGGNGIGQAVVLGLLARGARVAAVDLSEVGLAQTALLAGGTRLTTHIVDITDRAAVAELPGQVLAAHGHVDGVLNVAGIIQRFVPVTDLALEEIEKVMAVNFWGVVYMTKAFLPHLLRRPAASIVNVSSMGGLAPVPGQSAYGASKAAVKLFTEGLFAELQGTPVAATIVFPGAIATDITANSGVDRLGEPTEDQAAMPMTSAADAAEQIITAMEGGAYRVTVGKDATLIDRLARLMPRRTTELVAKKMAGLIAPAEQPREPEASAQQEQSAGAGV